MVRLTVRGWGRSAPSALAISKFENFGSQGVILDGFKKTEWRFKKTIVEKTIMALETPCPLMAKVMQNVHSFWTTSLNSTAFRHLERSSQSSN